MTNSEWEAVCDGCGKCCLHKLVDEAYNQSEEVLFTNISCFLLNTKTCACSKYESRKKFVADCVTLTASNINQINFVPASCSYKRLHEGRGLAHWHPLLNKGKKTKMHELGISVRNKIINEQDINIDDLPDYIVKWPLNDID